MQIIACIIRSNEATTVDLFATEAQALAEVKAVLAEQHGLEQHTAKDWTDAQVSDWINEEGLSFEFTFQDTTAPAYRITVTDLVTEAVLMDRLVNSIDLTRARESLGAAWNQYGYGLPNREAILWSTGSDDPVERITSDA